MEKNKSINSEKIEKLASYLSKIQKADNEIINALHTLEVCLRIETKAINKARVGAIDIDYEKTRVGITKSRVKQVVDHLNSK
uniref:Conjugal transfer protein n=1 Tax=Strongyloides papillosus TaxID=174720 RepID=A0A0N5C1C8_STREA